MKEFKLEIDTNTVYVKAFRFLGAFLLGLSVGLMFMAFKSGAEIDWFLTVIIILPVSLALAFFPFPNAKKRSLTINENGIFTEGYAFHYQERNKMHWEKIRSIRVTNSWFLSTAKIKITNTVGTSETIQLPLHTKNQLQELREYLEEAAEFKGVEFSV
ncbi:MAG: hypothetical protein MI700_02440 [Balneolales bacterium]|nr:hypothetical protein [Balneolales bacterium]